MLALVGKYDSVLIPAVSQTLKINYIVGKI